MGLRGIRRLLAGALLAFLPAPLMAQNPSNDDARARLIVDVDRLAGMLDDPDLVLLHVGDRAEYDAEHIRGAHWVEMARLAAPRPASPDVGLILELPEPSVLKEQLEGLGISDNSRIVVYYGNDWVSPSTRILLTLEYAGLGDRTSLLDGGMTAWKSAGHPVTADPAPEKRGSLRPLVTRDVVVTMDEVLASLGKPGTSIVDARAPQFFEGRYDTPGQRPGRIAGARSIPFSEITDETLRVNSTARLRALFRDAGVADGDTIIAYCHIGQQATAVVFAARLLGHSVMLYDGSYTEWGRPSDRPIETGARSST